MKKLSIICTVIFVLGMITTSAFAQVCNTDAECIDAPLLKCFEGQCVECIESVDCVDDSFCNGDEICTDNICLPGVPPCNEDEICDDEEEVCIFDGLIVQMDIKPGSCKNPLNVRSRGVLPVAILGTKEFDVTTIDPDTIEFTREVDGEVESIKPPIRYNYEDVGTPLEGELCECDDLDVDDLNEDGYMDLTLKVRVRPLVEGLFLNDVESRETILLTIMGETTDGTPIVGEDCVKIINKFKWWDDLMEKIKKPKKPKNRDEE